MKKRDNLALTLGVLVRRNIQLYIKDKMMVFFSILAPIIVLLLYILFLGDLQINSIMDTAEFASSGLGKADLRAIINNWMISGVMGVSCITVALNANACMVRDRQTGNLNDILSSPVKRWLIYASYIITTFIITFCICLLVLMLSIIYLAATGGLMMSFVHFLAILGITILSCICSAFFIVLICGFIKSVGALSAANGILATAIGFFIGAYLPFSMLPKAIQYVGCFLPWTYSAALFKNYFLTGVVDNLMGKVANPDLIGKILSDYSIELEFFGMKISAAWMVFALIVSILLFASILLILYSNKKTNFFSAERFKKRIRKNKKGTK